MIKRIKIISDMYDHNGNNRAGEEFDALVIKDHHGALNASFDVGGDYSFGLSNFVDMDPNFEIVGDVQTPGGDIDIENLKNALMSAEQEVSKLREDLSYLSQERDSLQEDLDAESNKTKEIERGLIQDGYAILPLAFLDNDLAKEFQSESEKVINRHELIAMCSSAQMEINKGDTSAKSLNVKLYMAMREFVEDEMDALIEAGREQS